MKIRINIEKIENTGNAVTAYAYTNYGHFETVIDEITQEPYEAFIIDSRAPYNLCYGFERSPVETSEIIEKLTAQLTRMKKEDEEII